jgi:hypothetical protein
MSLPGWVLMFFEVLPVPLAPDFPDDEPHAVRPSASAATAAALETKERVLRLTVLFSFGEG